MKRTLLILAFLIFLPIITFAQSNHGLNFTWTLSTTPGITSQPLSCATTSGGENWATPTNIITNGTSTTYLWTGGIAGTKYYCEIEACITQGTNNICSTPSNEVSATFPTVPNSPTTLGVAPQ